LDIILAVLQSAIGIAGLTLVFAAFLQARAASFDPKRGERYRRFAAASVIPVSTALAASWISVAAIEGNQWAAQNALLSLKMVLLVTGAYAIVGIIWSALL
jgi:hypothetical protein